MPTSFDSATLDFEDKDALSVLRFAHESYPNSAYMFSGSLEDVILLHMAGELRVPARVFFIDTGRHFEETYAYVDDVRRRLQIGIQWIFPDPAQVAQQCWQDGATTFKHSVDVRRRCCQVRRIEPSLRVAANADALIVGARRGQTPQRATLKKVGLSQLHAHGIRIAPLADWPWKAVIGYVQQHNLPIHDLYRKQFTSIGCAPCSRAIRSGEVERAGRWDFESAASEQGAHISGSW